MTLFSKAEPPPVREDDEETARAIAQVRNTRNELAMLRTENSQLRMELDSALDKLRFYTEQLNTMRHDCDMYRRHAVALYTRLIDEPKMLREYADRIEKALVNAKVEATSGGAAERKALDVVETGLSEMVANLKGSNDAKADDH